MNDIFYYSFIVGGVLLLGGVVLKLGCNIFFTFWTSVQLLVVGCWTSVHFFVIFFAKPTSSYGYERTKHSRFLYKHRWILYKHRWNFVKVGLILVKVGWDLVIFYTCNGTFSTVNPYIVHDLSRYMVTLETLFLQLYYIVSRQKYISENKCPLMFLPLFTVRRWLSLIMTSERVRCCPQCGNNEFIKDYVREELYCNKCGLVLQSAV